MNIKSKLEEYIILKKDKVKISSKEIKKNDIFLALNGKNYHGNKFINSSIKNGAKFCITDNKNYTQNEKVIFVKNIYDYLIGLAKIKRDLFKGKIIGITGSAGKTTLKETLAFFLKKDHKISFSKKSYNNKLGVLVSLLNLDLNSSFAIFEIGTNNFGEIKYLTKIVKPTEVFITNIQSTHLENFQTKNNIAREKSNIFILKNNNRRKKIYLNINNKSENIILNRAKKEKNLKIININKPSRKYFIKKILPKKNAYKVYFSINKKIIIFNTNSLIMFRLMNLLFCYAFFSENSLKINSIKERQKYLKPVDGRGLTHNIVINKNKIKVIDESYNANPDTMFQSIEYFVNLKKINSKKILILGNMNELGISSYRMHINLLYYLDNFIFKFVILCGEFFQRSIKKINNPQNEFIYLKDKNKIMKFLNKNIHNDDIILIKCSNSTEINKLAKDLLKKGNLN